MKLSSIAASLLGRSIAGVQANSPRSGDALDTRLTPSLRDEPSSILKPKAASQNVVSLNMWRDEIDPIASHLRFTKRNILQTTIDNMITFYFVNITSEYCGAARRPCLRAGTYNASRSSTHAPVEDQPFDITYADGTEASGDFVTDTLALGDADVADFQFGVALRSSSAHGVLGIGYPQNQANVIVYDEEPYENLPARLTSQGAHGGTVLFGGLDRARYTGPLVTVPIQPENDRYRRLLVTLDRLALDDDGDDDLVADDMALAVLLDSGSTLSYLPEAVCQPIYAALGATYVDDLGLAFVPCTDPDRPDRNLTFFFDDPLSIVVPSRELILDLATSSLGDVPDFGDGVDACLVGIAPAVRRTSVLGDTFMRSAYIVFDLANNEISMAQSAVADGNVADLESDIVEIGDGADAIPGAMRVDNPVAAKQGLNVADPTEDDAATTEGFLGSAAPVRNLGGASTTMAAVLALVAAAAAAL
ncbi:unnamed protein product [Parascedosporium putredinis]|uniref:Peptidase A1 domain-containing protein n=1 Tax=Parascedosporium putredinis TaxID=1442378 RepID=A0A9P1HDA5_9PEZI|nr:unnamed protein product [Parascedosporium putredinis]CAI8003877.1 unnamed protein product [Parascedosporium putredinis]